MTNFRYLSTTVLLLSWPITPLSGLESTWLQCRGMTKISGKNTVAASILYGGLLKRCTRSGQQSIDLHFRFWHPVTGDSVTMVASCGLHYPLSALYHVLALDQKLVSALWQMGERRTLKTTRSDRTSSFHIIILIALTPPA